MTHISDPTYIVLMSVPFRNGPILSVTIAEFYILKSGTVEALASFYLFILLSCLLRMIVLLKFVLFVIIRQVRKIFKFISRIFMGIVMNLQNAFIRMDIFSLLILQPINIGTLPEESGCAYEFNKFNKISDKLVTNPRMEKRDGHEVQPQAKRLSVGNR